MPKEGTGHRTTGKPWPIGAALVALAAVGVCAVLSATDGQNHNTSTPDPTPPVNEQPVTAAEPTTTTKVPAQVDGYGIEVTDTTLPAPQFEQSSAQAQETPTTTAPTRAASPVTTVTTDELIPRRVLHPTWDNRLPSTREGLPATECAKQTFRIEMRWDIPSWDYDIINEGELTNAEAAVIELALADPSYEVEPGRAGYTKMENAIAKLVKRGRRVPYGPFEQYNKRYNILREALTDLGVSSAQHIRDMGEPAANVRWYAARVKSTIDVWSLNPDHPSCASILAGAEAALTPYKPNTTTPLTGN